LSTTSTTEKFTGGEIMPEQVFNLLGSIVTVALVAVVLSSPNMVGIIRAFGDFFAGSINAAQKV
jgi:hypothetical protein